MDPDKMRGRLESVHIEDVLSEGCAFGRFHGESILVNNGADYAGMECIVKFNLWPLQGGAFEMNLSHCVSDWRMGI